MIQTKNESSNIKRKRKDISVSGSKSPQNIDKKLKSSLLIDFDKNN